MVRVSHARVTRTHHHAIQHSLPTSAACEGRTGSSSYRLRRLRVSPPRCWRRWRAACATMRAHHRSHPSPWLFGRWGCVTNGVRQPGCWQARPRRPSAGPSAGGGEGKESPPRGQWGRRMGYGERGDMLSRPLNHSKSPASHRQRRRRWRVLRGGGGGPLGGDIKEDEEGVGGWVGCFVPSVKRTAVT